MAPIQTYVEDGQLVGFLPTTGDTVRIPLREIVEGARAELAFTPRELAALDTISGDTVGGVIDEVGAGKVAKKIKKAIKAVAKSKIVKGIVKVVKKAVPPPFNIAVKAAEGAAKLGKALASKSKKPKAKAAKAKAKKIVPAVRAAAAGKISSKKLVQKAKKVGVKPSVAVDAAVIKRLATDARTNVQAAAALRLSKDLTSTEPVEQARAARALEADYQEPTTSRESEPDDAPLEAPMVEDEQAAMTEDPYEPEAVAPFEVDEGEPPADETEGAYGESVEGWGYY